MSVGESGQVGSLLRRGRGKASSACGALIAIKNDIAKGGPVAEDADDDEYVQLKKQVISRVATNANEAPSLVQVTKAALSVSECNTEHTRHESSLLPENIYKFSSAYIFRLGKTAVTLYGCQLQQLIHSSLTPDSPLFSFSCTFSPPLSSGYHRRAGEAHLPHCGPCYC